MTPIHPDINIVPLTPCPPTIRYQYHLMARMTSSFQTVSTDRETVELAIGSGMRQEGVQSSAMILRLRRQQGMSVLVRVLLSIPSSRDP